MTSIKKPDGELYAVIKKETCPDPCKEKEYVVLGYAGPHNIPAGWYVCPSYSCKLQVRAEYDRAGMYRNKEIAVLHPSIVLPNLPVPTQNLVFPKKKRKVSLWTDED